MGAGASPQRPLPKNTAEKRRGSGNSFPDLASSPLKASAAHPSPGWVGPTVVGGLAGAGYRISTSGSPERAGIVHRLDVGTSGVMVVAKRYLLILLCRLISPNHSDLNLAVLVESPQIPFGDAHALPLLLERRPS